MIHNVITTSNPFPYTAKFMFVSVGNNKTQQINMLKDKLNTYKALLYINYIYNSFGRMDNFLTKAGKLSILQTSLHIFDIRQSYLHTLYLF